MLSIGFIELAVILLFSFISLIIPTATLVLLVLIYRKLNQVEKWLDREE